MLIDGGDVADVIRKPTTDEFVFQIIDDAVDQLRSLIEIAGVAACDLQVPGSNILQQERLEKFTEVIRIALDSCRSLQAAADYDFWQ